MFQVHKCLQMFSLHSCESWETFLNKKWKQTSNFLHNCLITELHLVLDANLSYWHLLSLHNNDLPETISFCFLMCFVRHLQKSIDPIFTLSLILPKQEYDKDLSMIIIWALLISMRSIWTWRNTIRLAVLRFRPSVVLIHAQTICLAQKTKENAVQTAYHHLYLHEF